MNTMTNRIIVAFVAILLVLLGAWAGSAVASSYKDKQLEDLLGENARLHKQVETTRTSTKRLTTSLADLTDENTLLADLVAELRDRPEKIQYITRVETVVVPEVKSETFEEPPDEFVFKLMPDLPVARFSYDESSSEPYGFETYALTFRNSIVISPKSSSSLLQISSEKNPDVFVEGPIDELSVDYINNQKLFEPHVGVGLTVAAGVQPDLLGSVFVSFIHPTKNIDTVGLRIAANGTTTHFIFDPIGFNVGHHIPIFTDLWLHAGAGIDIYASPYGHVSLGTKF